LLRQASLRLMGESMGESSVGKAMIPARHLEKSSGDVYGGV
jgi:hypothetical protein